MALFMKHKMNLEWFKIRMKSSFMEISHGSMIMVTAKLISS